MLTSLFYLVNVLHSLCPWRTRKLIACGFSGFNAAVAGCFFSIETVLRPLRAENSPPFTTAMIILASVVSSTVSNVILGDKAAFIVPAYELRSAAGIIFQSRFIS